MKIVKRLVLSTLSILSISLSSCFNFKYFDADYIEKTYESTRVAVRGNPPITIISASMTFKYIDEATYLSRELVNVYKDTSINPNRFVSYDFKYVNELNETHSISFKTDIVGIQGNDCIKMHLFDDNYTDWDANAFLSTVKKNGREVIDAQFTIYFHIADISTSHVKDNIYSIYIS